MNHYNFPQDLIFLAYKKLKHYFYYDNSTLDTRQKIADFEIKNLSMLENIDQMKAKIKELVDLTFLKIHNGEIDISAYILPKKIKKPYADIITNYRAEFRSYEVERLNILCNASVEIHIICTLWMIEVGRFVEKTISTNNFAYKMCLDIKEDDDIPWESLKLYKPYFVQYQDWRDKAIRITESLLEDKRNVTIISLDIKDYFHSVELNFDKLINDVKKERDKFYKYTKIPLKEIEGKTLGCNYLNKTLHIIHKAYLSHLKEYHDLSNLENDKYPLPIGLISSGLLGNYYLNEFDQQVVDELNPAYYGRYVDDLMFVFADLKIDNEGHLSTINTFLNRYFVKRKVLAFLNDEGKFFKKVENESIYLELLSQIPKRDSDFEFDDELLNRMEAKQLEFRLTKNYHNLKIQASKVIMHYFDHRESRAALNKFKHKLDEQRSEFRFLPDEDEVSQEFDEEAFSLQYNDSINKFRSIQDFTEDKYGASKFLAKKIFARNFGEKEEDEKTDQQILTFFKDYVGISFSSLWEKVATYFVVSNKGNNLIKFKRNIEFAINKVEFKDPMNKQKESDFNIKIKNSLTEVLKLALAVPLALNPNIKLEYLNKEEENYITSLKDTHIQSLRRSNLFRQGLVNLPFINFTKYLETNESLLISNPNSLKAELLNNDNQLDLDPKFGYLAPNYVSFHEVNIFKIAVVINSLSEDLLKKDYESSIYYEDNKQYKKLDIINRIPDDAFDIYYNVNYGWKRKGKSKEELKKIYFNLALNNKGRGDDSHINIDVIGEIDTEFDLEGINKKIAIANMKVHKSNISKSINEKPNVNKVRRQEIFRLLNLADKNRADLIVFPEVSIPYSWLRLLAERSHKRYMGIIAGLEHWININSFAFNFMVTVLPFKVNHYKTSLIKIRLKNHYAPSEREDLRGHRLLIPGDTIPSYPKMYDLFHWRRTYFSVYNCFELADIAHRSIFKAKVDFLVASEYNSDTNYFSDIAGAWVRDVHCYFIQVNSSDFGDSRLIQPSKSYSKDLIQVKGGINSTVLVGELDIEKLRDFQYVEYNLQREKIDKGKIDMKPTPPDFDRKEVQKRIKNKNLIEKKD